ncbi:DNA translocase FtsK [Amnibacterium kyonggiense]|uniref:DNA translocase FtsK n=1 Tax=Amnibacterium kyonggiense TaxID=595671 RepID=UPI00105C7C9E|nr:DNA translocase FtsK [Amnibacterium kyonggiense]
MTITDERRALPPVLDELDERNARYAAVGGAVGFGMVLIAFWAWWPAGVVLGLVVGTLAVLHVGRAMTASAFAEPADGLHELAGEEELRAEFRRLRVRLGDDWPVFRRAALQVTHAQWASVAGLQRELRVSTATAQHLMGQLEREGFVGPSRGTRPRVVRLARDRAPELDRLMRL